MGDVAFTPSIAVTIGRQTRLYHAFVTTAPTSLDSPSTLTLYLSTLADVSGFAATPVLQEAGKDRTNARLVLVDARELTWQRARCREYQHILAPADPLMVGLTTLQLWLWQRLKAPVDPNAVVDGHAHTAAR